MMNNLCCLDKYVIIIPTIKAFEKKTHKNTIDYNFDESLDKLRLNVKQTSKWIFTSSFPRQQLGLSQRRRPFIFSTGKVYFL